MNLMRLVLLCVFTAVAPVASAFTCLTETPRERMARADVVFEGIVINSQRLADDAATRYRMKKLFGDLPDHEIPKNMSEIIVTETFKGETQRIQELWVNDWGYGWGAGYHHPGKRAVFFARYSGDPEKLTTDPCLDVYYLYREDYRPLQAADMWKELGTFDLD